MESKTKTLKSLSLPLITRIQIWAIEVLFDLLTVKEGQVNRCFINFITPRDAASSETINGISTYDVVVDKERKLWFRVFVPTQYASESLPVLVFFHGGGFMGFTADASRYTNVCYKFARELPAIVVSVDYRLTPENRHPAQHDDCLDVLKFLDVKENISSWLPENADISRCFLGGDSAGAHITHYVAERASQVSFQRLQVLGLLVIQPFFGGEERTDSEIRLDGTVPLLTLKRTDWLWNAFMPLDEPHNRDDPFINVNGPNATDISKIDLPPALVVTSGYDILRDRQTGYYDWLKNSGKEAYLVDYPNMFHAFYLFPELPESDEVILDVKDFVDKILNQVNMIKSYKK